MVNQRLKGSILIESMLSMVIVMTCFGAGLAIYAKISSSDNNRLRLRAQLLTEETAIRTKREKRFVSETLEAEPLRLVKMVSPYKDAPGALLLVIEAYSSEDQKLAEHYEIIQP